MPQDWPWGLPLLQEDPALEVIPWFDREWSPAGLPRLAKGFMERLFPMPSVFWSRGSRRLRSRTLAAQQGFDVAVSVNNAATATLLALRRQGRLNRPVVCLLVGVADWLERAGPEARKQTLDYLSAADLLLALGNAEVDHLRTCGLARTQWLPFGVDTDYWAPTGEPVEDYVFAVGSDSYRDFDTLVQACPYPLKLMTRRQDLVRVPLPPTVSMVQGGVSSLRQLYARSRLVVVPLKDSLQPSGQTTTLQAMAMGKAVILTRTRGTWTEDLLDGEDCVYVPPADPPALGQAIRALYDSPLASEIGARARMTACSHFPAQRLAEGLREAVLQIVPKGETSAL
jgi:glycosyltransferase involved in cell wall biosynthesis